MNVITEPLCVLENEMRVRKVELYLLLSGGNVALSRAFWKFVGVFYVVSLFAGQVPVLLDVLWFQHRSAKKRNCLVFSLTLE